jgi:chromate transporter
MNEVAVLLVAGTASAVALGTRRTGGAALRCFGAGVSAGSVSAGALATAAVATPFGLAALFLVFLKIGAILYGSGYVLLAFLHADLVEQRNWLTDDQLLDAIAVGQMTPGPVFTTATFVGYLLGGVTGGVVATAGIFLPAFAFVAISGPLIPRLRRSRTAGAFLDGVNVASLALMGAVTLQLVRAAIVDASTLTIALASAILVVRYRVNSAWLVLAGGVAGIAIASAGWRH